MNYRWYDEPDFIRIEIENSYLENLISRAIGKAKTIENLSKLTHLSKATIHNYKNCVGINIKGLKIILDFLNIKYDRINHKIKTIGWNSDKLKINFNSNEMAIILSASLADGHISKSHFMYKNKNLELINKVKTSITNLFGENIKINDKRDRNGTPYILCPSFLKRQLETLGSPAGKKLFQNPHVPPIVKNGTKEFKKYFIQQFFDDEGWAGSGNRVVACSQSADTTKSLPKSFIQKLEYNKSYSTNKIPDNLRQNITKSNLLIDVKQILEKDFNIYSNLKFKRLKKYKTRKGREYISSTWELVCYRKEDIKRFYEDISFYSSKKQQILKEMIEQKSIPKDIASNILNLAIKFQKQKGYFDVMDMQNYIDLEKPRIRKRLNTLVKQNILSNNGGKYSLKLSI